MVHDLITGPVHVGQCMGTNRLIPPIYPRVSLSISLSWLIIRNSGRKRSSGPFFPRSVACQQSGNPLASLALTLHLTSTSLGSESALRLHWTNTRFLVLSYLDIVYCPYLAKFWRHPWVYYALFAPNKRTTLVFEVMHAGDERDRLCR